MNNTLNQILTEVRKAIVGKDKAVEQVLMAILADGHILLDDVPGVGKTTLAVTLSRALGIRYHRIQFTPDVLPSDIVGFTMYDKASGSFRYMPGVVNGANLLLADEINRTSSKTQSALLEAMEERQVTVDGQSHGLEKPFVVIATENQVGTAGTQRLPQAQLDRFLVQLTIGYPDYEAQMAILRDRKTADPMEQVQAVTDCAGVLRLQKAAMECTMSESILDYITRLAIASRKDSRISLGISPRGALAVSRMARACAYLRGRDYVVPEDVREIFIPVCGHRILVSQQARMEQKDAGKVLADLLERVEVPRG